tara:strand:+ start:539 stop:865 length:327 start_codon:yes stop_codon:yes gene_type:complete
MSSPSSPTPATKRVKPSEAKSSEATQAVHVYFHSDTPHDDPHLIAHLTKDQMKTLGIDKEKGIKYMDEENFFNVNEDKTGITYGNDKTMPCKITEVTDKLVVQMAHAL